MRSYGTGPRFRSELETIWPEAQDRVSDVKLAQVRDPLHLCEVPESMYPTRERLAVKWANRTPIIPLPAETKKPKKAPAKSGTQSTGPKKRSRTQKNTKKKG